MWPIYTQTLIDALKDCKIDLIQCGYNHNYCRSKCGKHRIWGRNDGNECLRYELGQDIDVSELYRIDHTWKQNAGIERVIDVIPAYYSTKIIGERFTSVSVFNSAQTFRV